MNTAREFTDHLAALLRTERGITADFLLAVAELDRRKLYRELGHASLFSYLTRELKLSAGAAQYRKTAAELVQRFPEVEQALRDGDLCMTSVIELAKVLTPENRAEVLPRFFGLSSRDAAFVAASIRPVENPPRREVLGPIRSAAATAQASQSGVPEEHEVPLLRAPEVPPSPPDPGPATTPVPAPVPPKPSSVRPLDAELARLSMTVSRRFLGKLEAAKHALSHARPGASTEDVLEAALDVLLAERAKRRGVGVKPRKAAPPADPGTVTAAVKRAVMERSGGCCEWIFPSGERCGSPVRTEFEHCETRAHGGTGALENVKLYCRAHNDLAARRVFGDEWIDRCAGKRARGG